MGVVIVGGGIAGLASAIKLKLNNPSADVLLLDKPNSNSQIAGQRYRERVAHETDRVSTLERLIAQRSGQPVSEGIKRFVESSEKELIFWRELAEELGASTHISDLPIAEHVDWFGPKFGGEAHNAGFITLDWFRKAADIFGVRQIKGEALSVVVNDNRVNAIDFRTDSGVQRAQAEQFVFAGGNPGGSMFVSTNKRIGNTPHELLLGKGVNFVGATNYMIHPFGRCKSDGSPTVGCHETDNLAGARIFLQDEANGFTEEDFETEEMLENHQAHYFFPQLARKFFSSGRAGGVFMIQHADRRQEFARPAHHYSQLGIDTKNYVEIRGLTNSFAVGDAAGIGRYTNYWERLPGMALTVCLIDADILTAKCSLDASSVELSPSTYADEQSQQTANAAELSALRELNTEYLLRSVLQGRRVGEKWLADLQEMQSGTPLGRLGELSQLTAQAFYAKETDLEFREPYRVLPEANNPTDPEINIRL